MRRSWLVASLAVLMLGGAGCTARPAGADGNLVNGWAAMPAAAVPTPVVGSCYRTRTRLIWDGNPPVDCTTEHDTETAYVGTFTGDTAAAAKAPRQDTQAVYDAFSTCTGKANAYLGLDWQTSEVDLDLVVPADSAWAAGAHWYRCDLIALDANGEQIEPWIESLKDLPHAETCLTADDSDGSLENWQDVPCTAPHNVEFAGVLTAPAIAFDDKKLETFADPTCEGVVAKYLGESGATYDSDYLGYVYIPFTPEHWHVGDRTTKCYTVALDSDNKATIFYTGTVKGLRAGKPTAWTKR